MRMKEKVHDFVASRVEKGNYPGCQVIVARGEEILAEEYLGSMVKGSDRSEDRVTENTLFNLESITKVMVTLPLAFKLLEEGRLCLEDRLAEYLPEFATSEEKKRVTFRDMLNFTGGISLLDPPGSEAAAAAGDMQKCWQCHYEQPLETSPGSRVFYSDVSCRLLGKALERISGMDLQEGARKYFFEPLGMNRTFYCPPNREECADTGISESRRPLRGQLCQDLEHNMGEILGSDGIFSTARDMLRFSRMILQEGTLEGMRVLGPLAAERMTGEITNPNLCEEPVSYLHYILSGPKVWFWEYAQSPFSFFGDLCSSRGIGKMGGAGTFLYLDPEYDLAVIYLTNYGQPENTLEGDAAWNLFQKNINVMGLCNLVLGELRL